MLIIFFIFASIHQACILTLVDMTFIFSNMTSSHGYLLDIGELEGGLSRDRVFSGQTLTLLTRADNLTSLATLIDSNDINLLEASSALETNDHVAQSGELVEGKLTLEDVLRGLATVYKAALQGLNEGHGLLHLTELADLGVQVLVVEGDTQGVEGVAHQVNVLLLPSGELFGNEDSKLLGLAGVKASGLALGELLGEVGLGTHDVAGSATDVVLGSGQLGRGLGNNGEASEVNGLGLLEDLEPNVFSPVGNDGRHDEGLKLNVAQDDITVHANTGGSDSLTVAVTGANEVVETRLQGELEVSVLVVLLGLANEVVKLVAEELVGEGVSRAGAESLVLGDLFNPLLQGVKTENATVGNGLVEVGVLDCIS